MLLIMLNDPQVDKNLLLTPTPCVSSYGDAASALQVTKDNRNINIQEYGKYKTGALYLEFISKLTMYIAHT